VTRAYESGGWRRPPAGAPLPWILAAGAVGCQVAYPLVEGAARTDLTVATVVVFFLASVAHAWTQRGVRWAVVFTVVAVGGGLAAEAVGVRTGWPFGDYSYAESLGPRALGVPVVVPLAWAMMAYPALVVARRLTRRWVPLVGGVALASWDLFLDPQMVAEGHWRWVDPEPHLPGIAGVPVTNLAGWLAVSVVLMLLLDRLPRRRVDDAQPALLYLWTYASSVLANAVFFDRPGVAIVGGIGMGLVAAPFAVALWNARP